MKANIHEKGKAADVAQQAKAPSRKHMAAWLVPTALLMLSFIPLVTGALRLIQLAGGPEIMPANPWFAASPLPVVLHIVSAGVYALLGAFQFVTSFRRRWPGWHRVAGRFLVLCGLLVGLSALWMTLFFPRADGAELLYVLRLLFGSGMILSIVLGFAAVRRRDMTAHRAWMMRAYAIGLGAGTQALTLMAGELIAGPPNELSRALLMGTGWLINLAVVEWAIRKRSARPARTASVVDRCYPREQMVGAHTYVGIGHKKGNVVIKVKQNHNV